MVHCVLTTSNTRRTYLEHLKYGKLLGGRGFAPDPAGELTALPRDPGWWGGAGCPSPRTQLRPQAAALSALLSLN